MMGSGGVGAGVDPETSSTSSETLLSLEQVWEPNSVPPSRSQGSRMADQAALGHLQAMQAS